MALKFYNPTSPGRRGMTAVQGEQLTKKKPEKALTGFHLRTAEGITMVDKLFVFVEVGISGCTAD